MKRFTEPKIEHRDDMYYMGIRTQVPIRRMSKMITSLLEEIMAWLTARDISPSGPPLLRLHVVDMEREMDIELGWPVSGPIEGDDRVRLCVMPAGEYASLVYTGLTSGYKGNAALLNWGEARGLKWDKWDDEKGDAFGGRYESFFTDPKHEPDKKKWETEVAIRLADEQPVS